MNAPTAALTVEGLTVHYHGNPQPAIDDVAFAVNPGEGLIVTGACGSGKSTVLRASLGLVPFSGTVRLFGDIPERAPRGAVGYGPAKRDFPSRLTVRETVAFIARIRAVAAAKGAAMAVIERVGLTAVADRRTESLDAADQRRLSLAIAVVGDPKLVVIDDAQPDEETISAINAALARGATVMASAPSPAGFAATLTQQLALPDGPHL